MSFQSWHMIPPLRIMIINPLVHASKLFVTKFLSEHPFGQYQLIDIILLVYSNELQEANAFAQEVIACSFGCLNTIVATSDLPSISDADIFCCITNFKNPNILDFEHLDTEEQFDTFYLYIKVALSLGKSFSSMNKAENQLGENNSTRKPLFCGDGLIVLDIINSFGAENMAAAYICSAGIPALARSTIAEYLQVRCTDINKVYVWGANNENFHVKIEKPYIIFDKISDTDHCDWEMVSKKVLNPLKQDSTHFNACWMRKEFISKLKELNSKNPCGPLFRAWKMNRSLCKFANSVKTGEDLFRSMGFISDGSLRTIKGLPYFLPIITHGRDWTWEISLRFGDIPHVMQEIRKFNVIAKEKHDKLIKYCRKFLHENIINQEFVSAEYETVSNSFSSSEKINLD